MSDHMARKLTARPGLRHEAIMQGARAAAAANASGAAQTYAFESGWLAGVVRSLCHEIAQFHTPEPEVGQLHIPHYLPGGAACVLVVDTDDFTVNEPAIVAVMVNGADVLDAMSGRAIDGAETTVSAWLAKRNESDRAEAFAAQE